MHKAKITTQRIRDPYRKYTQKKHSKEAADLKHEGSNADVYKTSVESGAE